MTPIVNGLEEQYQDRVAFKRIDANKGDGPSIIRQYNIMGHPTILVFDQNGQETKRLLGPQSVEALDEILQQIASSATE